MPYNKQEETAKEVASLIRVAFQDGWERFDLDGKKGLDAQEFTTFVETLNNRLREI